VGTARRTAKAVHAARRTIFTNSLYGHHQKRSRLGGASPQICSVDTAKCSVAADSPRRTAVSPSHLASLSLRWLARTSDSSTRYRAVSSNGIERRVELDERCVSGVAVARHTVLVVPSIQIRTVDVDGKLDGPAVTVELPCQIMLYDAPPSFREFLQNRLTPANDRHCIGVVVDIQQSETGAVVESTIKVDGLDADVKAVEKFEELGEDLIQLLCRDFDILAEFYRKLLVEAVYDKI